MPIKSIYIFGPINLFGNDYIPVYKKLNRQAKNYFEKVICTYPDFWDSKEPPRNFYKRTYDTITKCGLFVAEISSPSHGVGMELQMAKERSIPIIAIARKDADISGSSMVLGLPNLLKVVVYEDLDDLVNKLEKEFTAFTESN